MSEIELNGHTYQLKMTFKALKEFGVVAGDMEKSTSKLGELYAGVALGDVFALAKVLNAVSGRSMGEVQKDIENTDNLDSTFEAVEGFFENSSLTKKLMAKIIPTVKETMTAFDKELATKA